MFGIGFRVPTGFLGGSSFWELRDRLGRISDRVRLNLGRIQVKFGRESGTQKSSGSEARTSGLTFVRKMPIFGARILTRTLFLQLNVESPWIPLLLPDPAPFQVPVGPFRGNLRCRRCSTDLSPPWRFQSRFCNLAGGGGR